MIPKGTTPIEMLIWALLMGTISRWVGVLIYKLGLSALITFKIGGANGKKARIDVQRD